MRKIVAISGLSVLAAGAVAVGIERMTRPQEAMTADLERDLSLATGVQSKRTGVVSPLEQVNRGGVSGTQPGQRARVLTQKRAPSAARSNILAEVAAAPSDRVDAAPLAPPATAQPLDSAASEPEPVTSMPTAAPDRVSSSPTSVAVGGPSAGGSMEGDRGSSDVGMGDDRRGRNGRGTDMPAERFPAGERQPTGVIATTIGVIGVVVRGGGAGRDHCELHGTTAGLPGPVGGIVGINGAIMSGGMTPPGSIAGGPRIGRRR